MPTSPKDIFSLARRELVTVRDLVRFAVSAFNGEKLFFGHGSADAFDEAAPVRPAGNLETEVFGPIPGVPRRRGLNRGG